MLSHAPWSRGGPRSTVYFIGGSAYEEPLKAIALVFFLGRTTTHCPSGKRFSNTVLRMTIQ